MSDEKTYRVLIGKVGLDGHDRGAKVIARALRDAGFEVVYTGLHQTPEMVVRTALQEDVDCIGISILSGAHNTLLPDVVAELEVQDASDIFVFAGGIIPDDDIRRLKEAGVVEVFTPGTKTTEVVAYVRAACDERAADRDSETIREGQMSLVDRILDGDQRAAARLMRLVDDKIPDALTAVDRLFEYGGHAYVVGFTGNPGSGKSTLVDRYIECCRSEGRSVGVVVVDPTSPFSGGAILGDRIRMNRHTMDEEVFIRSVATRGNLGGMSRSTPSIVQILDAMHFDVIVVETVGVGQDEVDIAAHADTCVVVTVPGLGDEIQASKAGILEVANIFAVNKSDRPESKRLKRELRTMLDLGPDLRDEGWEIPIVETVATTGEGSQELYDAVERHAAWMRENDVERDKKRSRYTHLIRLMAGGQFYDAMDRHFRTDAWTDTVDALIAHETTPASVVSKLRDAID